MNDGNVPSCLHCCGCTLEPGSHCCTLAQTRRCCRSELRDVLCHPEAHSCLVGKSDVIVHQREASAYDLADHKPGVDLANEQKVRAHLHTTTAVLMLSADEASVAVK